MTSVCISHCVNDARDPRIPVRATYVNLYKWPESDAEFVRSVTRSRGPHGHGYGHRYGHPRVVDSISCRQIYLRSYTFSREEENVTEKTAMCFGRAKEKKSDNPPRPHNNNNNNNGRRKRKEKDHRRKRKEKLCLRKFSCAALFRIFHRLLSCTASVDVVDGKN